MKEISTTVRGFFNSKGELPWEVLGGEPSDWELEEKKIVQFGKPELVQVWQNTKVKGYEKELKD